MNAAKFDGRPKKAVQNVCFFCWDFDGGQKQTAQDIFLIIDQRAPQQTTHTILDIQRFWVSKEILDVFILDVVDKLTLDAQRDLDVPI